MKKYLKELNKDQLKAATTTEGPVLILAGAGSGKTKTVIARTIHILNSKLAKANNILVMTFTNKAAREMKERGSKLLGEGDMPLFTTFHSWGVRLMKFLNNEQLAELGIREKFSIIDASDQIKLLDILKYEAIKSEEIAKEFSSKKFLLALGNIQNKSVRYDTLEHTNSDLSKLVDNDQISLYFPMDITDSVVEELSKLFFLYKIELRKNNSLDFDDLINLSIRALELNEELKSFFNRRYKYIMVDEFQDTNGTQFKLMKLLLADHNNLCVVGDDSQSIYGWRGANIGYILNFHKEFENCLTVNLSKNYRSKHEIVSRANKLLTCATQRHAKKADLIAHSKEAGQVKSYEFCDSRDEAAFIAKQIKNSIMRGTKPGEITILYRSFFVARNMEEALIENRIPYNIHKGKSLLERNVAKACIAYLRALHNKGNSLAISTLFELSGLITKKRASDFYFAIGDNMTMYEFVESGEYKKQPRITANIISKLDKFAEELKQFSNLDYNGFVEEFSKSNFMQRILSEDLTNEKKQDKAMSELNVLNIIYRIMEGHDSLDSVLETLSLEGEVADCEEDMVNCMTIHASKGLEFRNVFLLGAAQGIFPSEKSESIEEERRLFYVALTRAKSSMIITSANKYTLPNKEYSPSMFIEESQIDSKNMCSNANRRHKRNFF